MPQSYSHNTAVRHETDASRRPARSTRRTCRRTRAARSQHASRRSAAVSTRIVERRGPSRREGSAWKDDGRELRPWHQRHLTRDSSGADSRERRRVNVHDRPQAAATRAALEGQPTAAPRCACLKSLGDGGQRHRPPSTRAHVSWRTSRCGGRAVLNRRKHEVTSCLGPGAGPPRSAIVRRDATWIYVAVFRSVLVTHAPQRTGHYHAHRRSEQRRRVKKGFFPRVT